MPQRAKLEAKDVHAFSIESDDEWAALVRASDENTLTMPCCSAKAVCKTSNKGRRFFSHPPNSLQNCDAKDETERHEDIKIAVAKSIASLRDWNITTEAGCDVLCQWGQSKIKVGIEIELPSWKAPGTYLQQDKILRAKGIIPLWLIDRYQVEGFPNLGNRFELQHSPRHVTLSDATSIVLEFLHSISNRINVSKKIVRMLDEEGYETNVLSPHSVPTEIEGKRITDTIHIDLHELVARFTFDKEWMEFDHLRTRSLTTFDRMRSFFKRESNRFRIIGQNMPQPIFENHKQNITERNKVLEEQSSERKTSAFHSEPTEFNSSFAPNFSPRNNTSIDYGQMRLKLVREVALKVMPEEDVDEWMHTPHSEFDGRTPAQLSSDSSSAVFEVEVLLGLRDRQTRRPISTK